MGEKSKMPSGCGVWFISSIISVGTLEGSQVWEDEVSFGQSEFEVPVGHPSVGFSWAIKLRYWSLEGTVILLPRENIYVEKQ